jgi:protein O-mannosyl-transferase
VAMLIMAVEMQILGPDPGPLKFVSILIHLTSAFLVFQLIRKLFGRLDYALIVAGLFTVHTLQVEPVAWMAASMKVGTYSLFFLLSMLSYLHFLENKKTAPFLLSLLFFALSGFCKEQAVVLPVVLLSMDYLKGRKLLSRAVILEKIPFFAIALAFGLATLSVAGDMRGTGEALPYSVGERILFASFAITSYLLRHVLPVNLSTYYVYPPPGATPAWYYATPLVLLGVLAALWWAWKKDNRLLVFAMVFFLANIFLTILSQILSVRDVIMADRYVYLSTIGFFLAAAYFLGKWVEKRPALVTPVYAGLIAYGLLLAGLTYQRAGIWENSATVFTDAIDKARASFGDKCPPALSLPYNNRGLAKKNVGDTQGAMSDYEQAIACNPGFAKAYLNRGNLYFNAGQNDAAIESYNKGLEYEPANPKILSSRGAAYANLGKMDLALADLSKAIEGDPGFLDALSNRALVYHYQQQNELALGDVDRVLQLGPNNANMLNFKGIVLQRLGRMQEAELAINSAIQIDPNNASYYLNRAYLYRDKGERARALQDARQSQSLGGQVDPAFLNSLGQ